VRIDRTPAFPTMVVVAQRLKDKRLTGALLIVPLLFLAFLLTLEQNDGIVSAFVASTLKHGRTPTPALIVARDPSTVPAIDWDVFEREERYAFDTATIIPPSLSRNNKIDGSKFLPLSSTAPNPLLSNRADTSLWPGTTSGTTVPKIAIAPDDPDAWKGSLLMTAGLLVIGHHDVPALLLLLSTAAHGEFGTAVRLTSRCLWHSVTVCQVLSTAGFQSITELLKDVGVMEQPQPKNEGKENWMMSWAKRTWKDAVQQERKWADSIRQSLFEAPEEPNETMTMIFQAKEPVVVAAPTFAATLKREDGVVLHLPVVSTDPLSVSNINKEEKESGDEVLLQLPTMVLPDASSLAATNSNNNKQRVRDLMRQRREELQQNVDAAVHAPKLVVKAAVAPKAVVVDMEVARQQMTNGAAAADSRQRVRDLMRQKRVGATSGNSVSALADHKAAIATPSLVLAEKEMMMTTTPTVSLHPGDRTAVESRQRVRDLMRMQRERQQGYAAPATTSTGMFSATTTTTPSTSTPSLFTSPYTTTTAAANLQSATQRAAHSRQRVRDLLRQKQAREVDSRGTEGIMATVVTAPMIQECDVPVPAPQPKDEAAAPATSSFISMEEQFRKQRAINALVRNKIRGMRMQKRVIDNGSLKVKHEDEPAQYMMSVSGRTPLTVTEKKTLAQARAALATARQMQTQLAASANSSIEPETSSRRSWRRKICQLLKSASPHGWVAAKEL
jgi:hypothetical protein